MAERLKLTAPDLLDLGLVDGVVGEVLDGDTVLRALEDATPGDRRRRVDAATARWLS